MNRLQAKITYSLTLTLALSSMLGLILTTPTKRARADSTITVTKAGKSGGAAIVERFRGLRGAIAGLLPATTASSALGATITMKPIDNGPCPSGHAWSKAQCWDLGRAPITGDDVVMNGVVGSSNPATNYDLPASIQLHSITMLDGGGSIQITGAPIALQSDGFIIDTNHNGSLDRINAGFILNGPATFTLNSTTQALRLGGAITGDGPLTLVNNGATDMNLATVNSYTGGTTISGSHWVVADINGSIPTGSALTVNGSVRFSLASTVGSLAGDGAVFITGASTLTVGGDNTSTAFSGVCQDYGGNAALIKDGSGTFTLSGVNTYTGATTVNGGTLAVNGSLTSAVTVNSGGTLGGTGTLGNTVNVNSGGTLSPGTSPGIINTSAVTLKPFSTLTIELNGPTVGTQYDQVNVTGAVTLTNAFLDVALGIVPTAGQVFKIINNVGGAPVIGTFNGLPEGIIFTPGNLPFQLSYVGGDGDDVTLSFVCPGVNLTPLPSGVGGTPYSQMIAGSPAGGNYSFIQTGGTLPNGLTLQPNGLLSGTPTLAGSFSFEVLVTGFGACTNIRTLTMNITCPPLTLTALPSGVAGTPYSQTLVASPAGGNYSFMQTGGTLPNGLTLMANGLLSGTPTTAGSFSFDVKATGFGTCTNTQTLTVSIACPTLTLATLPVATAGAMYNQALAASPVGGNYTFMLAGGSLPPGLLLGVDGSITGTPTATGVYNFNVKVTGFGTCTQTLPVTLTVVCPTITLSSATLPNAMINTAYAQAITASPAGGGYTFAVTSGSLPAGLMLSSSGALSGAPAQMGVFNFRVTATGSGACAGFRDYQLMVDCTALMVSPTSLPSGTVGTGYSQSISATPAGAYSFAVTSGTLPTGLTLNSASGLLSGTPTANGTFIFTVTASAGGCTGQRSYTLLVDCPAITINPATLLTAGQAGMSYSQQLTVSPSGSYTFSLETGALPSGVTLNSATGLISGLPAAAGTYNFSVRTQAANGCFGTRAFTLQIACPTITISPASLPNGATGVIYSDPFSGKPAGGNYSFSVVSGSLPAGLTLNGSTGVLAGTPTAAGTSSFTLRVTGFGGCTQDQAYTLTVTGPSCPTITLADLPSGTMGQFYYGSLSGTLPGSAYTYSVMTGTLPPGLTLDTLAQAIYGTATTAGSFSFSLKATNANNCAGTKSYTVIIGGGALAIPGDFDGDRQADTAVFRSAQGNWLVVASGSEQLQTLGWGAPGDVQAAGDYDGDGKLDLAVFTPATGRWHIQRSSDNTVLDKLWGVATDIPVPGDYDGDGKTDIAVWRPSEGNWYISNSSNGAAQVVPWGLGAAPYSDVPVPGDYDGDGKCDLAVFRQSDGTWYIRRSSDGAITTKAWGLGTDKPVPGDYDGDGKTDIAVWRGQTSTWFIIRSGSGLLQMVNWGSSAAPYNDVPVPGDYDGDGKTDIAVWRPSSGMWYSLNSSDGSVRAKQHGQPGDVPVTARP